VSGREKEKERKKGRKRKEKEIWGGTLRGVASYAENATSENLRFSEDQREAGALEKKEQGNVAELARLCDTESCCLCRKY